MRSSNIKRILLFALSVLLLFALSIPSLASASTLNVTNTLTGRTYDAYLFFKMDNGNMTIKNNSPFLNTLDQYNREHPGKLIITPIDDVTYKVVPANDFTEDDAAILAQVAMTYYDEWKDAKVASQVATGTTVTFENLENDGYYLIKSSAGTVLSMVTVNGTGTINEKNTGCQWGEILFGVERDAIGHYELTNVTTTFKFTQNYDTSANQLKIVDEYMVPTGETMLYDLADFRILKGVSNEEVPTSWYTLDVTYHGYTLTLTDEAQFNAGEALIIKNVARGSAQLPHYDSHSTTPRKAEVSAHAKDAKAANPNDDLDVATDTVYAVGMGLTKLNNIDDIVLTGAQFKVYRSEDSTTPLRFFESTHAKGYTNYNLINDDAPDGTDIIEAGAARISGLGSGTYYFEEVKAPDGYNPLHERVSHTLTDDSDFAVINTDYDYTQHYVSGGLSVVNKYGIEIPATGGVGTIILITIGAAIIIGAISYNVSRRKIGTSTDSTS